MHLAVITGFLGSVKTTFVLRLTEMALTMGLKEAILINEVGESGIGNQFMRRLGSRRL